jgi:hypothetical protein
LEGGFKWRIFFGELLHLLVQGCRSTERTSYGLGDGLQVHRTFQTGMTSPLSNRGTTQNYTSPCRRILNISKRSLTFLPLWLGNG